MKRIKLMFIALITIFTSFSFASGEEIADDLDQGVTVPTCGHIYASETHTANYDIGLNITSASFILSRGETTYDMEMVLVTPSGTEIDPDATEPITYLRDANLIYYIVPYPEPGNWTAKIIAGAIPEMGEDYCAFTVLDEEEVNVEDETAFEIPTNLSDEAQDSEECEECDSQ